MGLRYLVFLLACVCAAQTRTRLNVAELFDFESGKTEWAAQPDFAVDAEVRHGGRYSGRIVRTADSAQTFSTATLAIPIDFEGARIELRGFLKTEEVHDFATLWMRIDGDSPGAAFATLQPQKIDGTRDWKEYSISVESVPRGKTLVFGFGLAGPGKMWADDLQLLVDGKPIAGAKALPQVVTALDTDHEFDAGSKFAPKSLSTVQVRNLAVLGKIWGFLKYHHPAVTKGARHWDYDLFRVLPAVTAAVDRAAANAAMLAWIDSLGEVPACEMCVTVPTDGVVRKPSLEWIEDKELLGELLSARLQSIYRNRTGRQFFVSITGGVGNPSFIYESNYAAVALPDAGYQLLGLFRFWNMVHYFYPARETMSDVAGYWDGVLAESIAAVTLAASKSAYELEMIRFVAKINDTHANLYSSLHVRPPVGQCMVPVVVRFVEGKAVVIRPIPGTDGGGLAVGDVITHLDGKAVQELVNEWRPFYAASNEPTRLRGVAGSLTNGTCGPAKVGLESGVTVASSRVSVPSAERGMAGYRDRPGAAVQRLLGGVVYLKLGTLKTAEAVKFVRENLDAKGMIIDMRNYPSDFLVFSLGGLLHGDQRPFVQFTGGDAANPGLVKKLARLEIPPGSAHFKGKLAILVDESTQSSAEYHAMAFRAVPGAVVIGSTTAGADGNISRVVLPGGLQSVISGLGVLYPDGRQTQRVGIVPDVWVTPTIAGIRDGRDEVLEEAMRRLE